MQERQIRSPRLDLAIIALLYAVMLAIRATAPSDLATGDQPLQLAYIDDLTQRDAWLVQRMPDGTVASKPPLYNWLAALPVLMAGRTELLLKLPSIVAGLGVLFLTWDFTRRAVSARAALVASVLLATSPMFAKLMFFARTDMLLALCILAQLWSAFLGRVILFWCAAELALLTKGPVGILLPMAALSAWWWHRGELGESWRRLRPSIGLPLALLPAGVWFGAALLVEGKAVWDQLIVAETFDRFRESSTKSKENRHLLYYVPHLIGRMAPASLLALAALPALPWKRRDASVLMPALWLLSMLLMLSLVPSKRADRLFPILPAVCMLAGWMVDEGHRSVRWLLASIGLVIAAAGGAIIFGAADLPAHAWTGVLVAACGLAMLIPRPMFQVAIMVLALVVGQALYQFRLRPDLLRRTWLTKTQAVPHATLPPPRSCPGSA